ncbi:MAG: hypothetical protein WDM91_00180 [Rhizomicrobium sp.]
MTTKSEIETSVEELAGQNSRPTLKAWGQPTYQKFPLRGSETANTNSNFDGTNYSS